MIILISTETFFFKNPIIAFCDKKHSRTSSLGTPPSSSTLCYFSISINSPALFTKKKIKKLGIENFLYPIKCIHKKPTVNIMNIILDSKRLNAFPLKTRREFCSYCVYYTGVSIQYS
jgi:hypothetical protein